MRFHKYHGLGNDYIVLEATQETVALDERRIRLICHRHFGVGSDGILLGPLPACDADFGLRIFNPDGSEAEKSGNGLRIFARFLWDNGDVGSEPFTVNTLGGLVQCHVDEKGQNGTVEMGRVSFLSPRIPMTGPEREVLNEEMTIAGETVRFCAATIGNPHCVVLCDDISEDLARRLGPLLETDSRFPQKTNVQFMQVLDRSNIRIEIWERGAGYTLASGSSSSAAAAVAHRLGCCGNAVAVHMPGGTIDIRIDEDYAITLSGPVVRVGEGTIFPEVFEQQV